MKTHSKIFTFFAALLLCSWMSPLEAHMDTELKYRFGKIKGLPEQYLPATFDKKRFVLTVGEQKYVFPKFLVDLIRSKKSNPKIEMHASWYHAGRPYLGIDFTAGKNSNIGCLFLLDDLSAVGVTEDTPLPNGYRTINVKLTESQKKELKMGLVSTKRKEASK